MSAQRAAERVRRAIRKWLEMEAKPPRISTPGAPAREEKAWMGTVTGKRFRPFDPNPDDIDIRDIARGLAMTCRYGGQVKQFYSVAEHCVHVSLHVPVTLALYGLLHDSAEAYIGDMIRPIKHQPQMSEFRRAEHLIEASVDKKFGLAWTPEYAESVKVVDDRILVDEILALSNMPSAYLTSEALRDIKPLGIKIQGWSPAHAEFRFLDRFKQLTGQEVHPV